MTKIFPSSVQDLKRSYTYSLQKQLIFLYDVLTITSKNTNHNKTIDNYKCNCMISLFCPQSNDHCTSEPPMSSMLSNCTQTCFSFFTRLWSINSCFNELFGCRFYFRWGIYDCCLVIDKSKDTNVWFFKPTLKKHEVDIFSCTNWM